MIIGTKSIGEIVASSDVNSIVNKIQNGTDTDVKISALTTIDTTLLTVSRNQTTTTVPLLDLSINNAGDSQPIIKLTNAGTGATIDSIGYINMFNSASTDYLKVGVYDIGVGERVHFQSSKGIYAWYGSGGNVAYEFGPSIGDGGPDGNTFIQIVSGDGLGGYSILKFDNQYGSASIISASNDIKISPTANLVFNPTGSIDFSSKPVLNFSLDSLTSTNSTLILSDDASNQTLTGNLGNLNIMPAGDLIFNPIGNINHSGKQALNFGCEQWTTGTRPAGFVGQIGLNTTTSQFEGYNGGAWVILG